MIFKKQQSQRMGVILISIAGILSHILGVGRDITLSHFFGAGLETDAYGTAFLFPDLIFNLMIGSTLTGVFLPIFSQKIARDKQGAEKLAGAFISIVALFSLLLCAFFYFSLPFLVEVFYSGFSEKKAELTISLSRILLASPLLFLLGNFLGSILLSQKSFFSYAFAPVLYNAGIILGIFFFHEKAGIYAACYGVVIGLVFYVLFRFLDFKRLNLRIRLNLDFFRVREVFFLAWPRGVGLFLWQANFWLYSFLASYLAEGSFAAFNFARNIETFPVSIFGVSVATASLPFLSDLAAQKNYTKFSKVLERAIYQILFFAVPAGVGMALLSSDIVDLIFQHGEFN